MHRLAVLPFCSWGLAALLILAAAETNSNYTIMKGDTITKPGCPRQCGNLTIPYPFGIKSQTPGSLSCSMNPTFDITCNHSTNPPKAFLQTSNLEVYNISDTELRISNFVAERCYNQSDITKDNDAFTSLNKAPYTFSNANVLTVVGCDDYAYIYKATDDYLPKGCTTTCYNADEVPINECSGTGCCQVSIKVLKYFDIFLFSFNNHTKNVSSFNPCGYAFFGDRDRFKFHGASDLNDPTFNQRISSTVPLVLDWVIENNTCAQAAQDSDSNACRYANSFCIDNRRSGGYCCSCKEGYEGNPYLSPGCQDIDECADPQLNGCEQEQQCTNTLGSYNCSCRHGYYFDYNSCIAQSSKPKVIKFILGIGFGCLSLIIGMNWLYCIMRKRKHTQLREKFFQQNGGLLLRQRNISKEGGTVESTKLFTDEELKKATNNYASDRILGQGGYGIVFKGILPE